MELFASSLYARCAWIHGKYLMSSYDERSINDQIHRNPARAAGTLRWLVVMTLCTITAQTNKVVLRLVFILYQTN